MRKYIIGSFIVSICIASFALYAGVTHNSMSEFCSNPDGEVCEFDFGYAAFIWLGWFIPTFALQLLVVIIVTYTYSFLTRRSSGR